MVLESRGQARARKVRHARGSAGDVRDRRNDIRRLPLEMWMPELLLVKRPARIRIFHELIADPPAIVPAFNQINPPGFVTAIRIIVAGEQVSILIEHQVLWIAQSVREYFQL